MRGNLLSGVCLVWLNLPQERIDDLDTHASGSRDSSQIRRGRWDIEPTAEAEASLHRYVVVRNRRPRRVRRFAELGASKSGLVKRGSDFPPAHQDRGVVGDPK